MGHLVEGAQKGPALGDTDAGDRRHSDERPPRDLVPNLEGPGHRGLDGRHVADDDDVGVGRVRGQLVARGADAPPDARQ